MLARGLLVDGMSGMERLLMLGGGTLALFIGVAVVSSRLVRPIAAVVGWPVARTGAAGALARENAVRNPARTASTAAALMIGLALVTFVSVLGAGLAETARVRRDRPGRGRARRHLGQRLGPRPARRRPRHRRRHAAGHGLQRPRGPGRTVDGSARPGGAASTRPPSPARTDFTWTEGSDRLARRARHGDGAIVEEGFAEDHDLSVGSAVRVTTPSGDDASAGPSRASTTRPSSRRCWASR